MSKLEKLKKPGIKSTSLPCPSILAFPPRLFCLVYIEIFDFITALLYDESYKYFVEQFKYFLVLVVAVRQKIYLVPELQHLVV